MTALHSSLRPHHVEMLRESGLSDATITERGYETAQYKTALTAAGFSAWQAKHAPALLIPIYDVHGALNMYQMRPDTAPVIDDKPLKYMAPKGAALCLDVPRSVQPLLSDPSVDLWITEGSKKVDAGCQHGLCMIGALGVTGWCHNGGVPREDWEQIALQGRVVFIAFDADVRRKIEVWRALQALKTFLEGRGARVSIVYLPDDANHAGKKVGLDDYLAAGNSVEALRGLASETLCPCPSVSGREPRNPLEKLRVEALTSELRGLADVDPHGGLRYHKAACLEEIGKKARRITYFYGRIDDIKKWDMIDTWMAADPYVPHSQRLAWRQQHFGRYAKQLGNWLSTVGLFAANTDGTRRPWLPMWLHALLRDLTPEQQETVFDTYEANGARMPQQEVAVLIAQITGVEPKPEDDETRPTVLRPRLSWEEVAQHVESVDGIGGKVAEHMLRVANERGDRFLAEYILACPVQPPDDAPAPWAGMDVYDAPPPPSDGPDDSPKAELTPNETPDAPSLPAANPDSSLSANNEIETSRQTRRTNFTTVKFDAPPEADLEGESSSSLAPTDTPAQRAERSRHASFSSASYGEQVSSLPYNTGVKFGAEPLETPDISPLCAFTPLIAWAERRAARYELLPDDMGQRVLDAVHNYRYFADTPHPPAGVLELMLTKLAHLHTLWCEQRKGQEQAA
jgi:hypothetical protein